MLKFTDWVLDKILTLKGIVLTGADNTKPLFISGTVYEDKAHSLIGKRLSNSIGKVDYDYNEQAVKFQSGGSITNLNDLVGANLEYPHQAKENGKIYPHIHIWQTQDTLDRIFTLQYRIQNNGSAKQTTWTTMTANLLTDSRLPYIGGTMNQIISFKDGSGNNYIDMNGYGLSATIQFKMTRTDSNTGDILATFFDFHYEVETLGSRQEIIR